MIFLNLLTITVSYLALAPMSLNHSFSNNSVTPGSIYEGEVGNESLILLKSISNESTFYYHLRLPKSIRLFYNFYWGCFVNFPFKWLEYLECRCFTWLFLKFFVWTIVTFCAFRFHQIRKDWGTSGVWSVRSIIYNVMQFHFACPVVNLILTLHI